MTGEHGYLDADRFVHIGFNGGGDIMSISPRDYEILQCNSPTGNVIIDDDFPNWRRILLEEKLKNSLVIYCKKKAV